MSLDQPKLPNNQPIEPKGPENTGLLTQTNDVIEAIRGALYGVNALENLADIVAQRIDPEVSTKYRDNDILVNYTSYHLQGILPSLDTNLVKQLSLKGLVLYAILAAREGFNWTEQLYTAKAKIDLINQNNKLSLKAAYNLPDIINALAEKNDPEKLYPILEMMQNPKLVLAPEGLAIDHFTYFTGVFGYARDTLDPEEGRKQAAVGLVDVGDISDLANQPEEIRENSSNGTITRTICRKLMDKLGMRLEADVYCLAAMKLANDQGNLLPLDINTTSISVLSNSPVVEYPTDWIPPQSEDPHVACVASGYMGQYYFTVYNYTNEADSLRLRLRPAVMADL